MKISAARYDRTVGHQKCHVTYQDRCPCVRLPDIFT